MSHRVGPRGGTFDGALRAGPSVVGCAIWEAQVRFFGWAIRLHATRKRSEGDGGCIFFLTFFANHLIYESHCDFFQSQNSMLGRISR